MLMSSYIVTDITFRVAGTILFAVVIWDCFKKKK